MMPFVGCIMYSFSAQEVCILAKWLKCTILIVFEKDLLINKISLKALCIIFLYALLLLLLLFCFYLCL
jgi:hypothetical protein